jgi:hypothetical protein
MDSVIAAAEPITLRDLFDLHNRLWRAVVDLEAGGLRGEALKFLEGSVGEFDVIYAIGVERRSANSALSAAERKGVDQARNELRQEILDVKASLAI